MSLLKVRGLVKSYGRRRVVDGVDFEVEPGEITVSVVDDQGNSATRAVRVGSVQ